VKILGRVTRFTETENVYFIEIQQPSTIDVLIFKNEPLSLTEGDNIEIIGKIDEYEGEMEIIGNRIRVIE
jgi:DNA/RNA endonuclease YhcR with UshA esterase domain